MSENDTINELKDNNDKLESDNKIKENEINSNKKILTMLKNLNKL